MRMFVDTSYYIARIVQNDQWHNVAVKAVRQGMAFSTSSLVVNETISLLQGTGYFLDALTFLDRVRRSEDIQVIHPDPVVQSEAWDLFGEWGSSGANAVDCVSFAHNEAGGYPPRVHIRRPFPGTRVRDS